MHILLGMAHSGPGTERLVDFIADSVNPYFDEEKAA
jgi:hypothetical protein